MTDNLEPESGENSNPLDNAVPVQEPSEEGAPLSRDIVSKIVERERKKAYEKGKREALMQSQDDNTQVAPQQVPQQQAPMAPQSLGGMQQMSPADIERMIAEKAPQLMQQHLQQQVQQHKQEQMVNTFVNKMQAAEKKYPGLEEKLNDLDYSTMVHVVPMINDLDNSGEVMKELVDNPEKLSNLITLSYTQPRLAQKRLFDLSNSIKTNEAALAEDAQVRDPLSQIKPSLNSGLPDKKDLSVKDLQRMLSQRK